jgi:hypothetical protein
MPINIKNFDPPSTIVIPRQPRWDCFGLFSRRSNTISPEAIARRQNEINKMNKNEVKEKLHIAEVGLDQMNRLHMNVPSKITTNIKMLKKKEAKNTTTFESVLDEEDIPQKISKFRGFVTNNLMKKKQPIEKQPIEKIPYEDDIIAQILTALREV